jgi:hypothetical protein
MKKMKPKRIAKLTGKEDKAWKHAFRFYLDKGYSDSKADEAAWKDLLLEFARLTNFDGCR